MAARGEVGKWLAVLILFPVCTAGPAQASPEWFGGLDLENAVAQADLILAVRVAEASARAAGKLLKTPGAKADDVRDRLAALLADADSAQELRIAALDALLALDDSRLEGALKTCVRDAGLEGSSLLDRTERLLRQRKVELNSL